MDQASDSMQNNRACLMACLLSWDILMVGHTVFNIGTSDHRIRKTISG